MKKKEWLVMIRDGARTVTTPTSVNPIIKECYENKEEVTIYREHERVAAVFAGKDKRFHYFNKYNPNAV